MSITVNGTIHGSRIDLDRPLPLRDGSPVTVRIEERPLGAEEKRRLLLATAGSWAADTSIAHVFAEVAERRRETVPRDGGGQ